MAAVLERRTTRAAGWSRRVVSFALVLYVMSGLGHRFGFIDTVSFFWLLGIVAAMGIVSLCFAGFAFARIWDRGDRGAGDAFVGALMSVAILAPFAVSGWQVVTLPSLTDISTDVVDPPAMPIAARERSGTMNPIERPTPDDAELQLASYPGAIGRRYVVSPDLVIQAVTKLAEQRGWVVRNPPALVEGQSELDIEMTAYTLIFAFPVDVAVRIVDEDAAIYVDMRSVSRWGKHDLGDNAARIETFLKALDAAVKTDPVAE